MRTYDVVIVGAGPAGLSTALHLMQADPSWTQRMLLLERHRHPRHKVCAGGITRLGLSQLQELGLSLGVPSTPVEEARFAFRDLRLSLYGDPLFVVVHRAAFDAWLAEEARRRGAQLVEGRRVVDLQRVADAILVKAAGETYQARVVVGADGSRGMVRRWVAGVQRPARVARSLEVINPARGDEPAFNKRAAFFDFSGIRENLQGYFWEFPSPYAGRPHFNRGLYDARRYSQLPRAPLPAMLDAELTRRKVETQRDDLQGHPIHWFTPRNRLSAERVVLVGDAAGADPLFGEGIGIALAYGALAARAIQRALAKAEFGFAGFRGEVLRSPLGRYLLLRWLAASLLYRLSDAPRGARVLGKLANSFGRRLSLHREGSQQA